MGKKDKDNVLDDYENLKDEIMIDRVNEIFRSQPDKYIAPWKNLASSTMKMMTTKKRKKRKLSRKTRIKGI